VWRTLQTDEYDRRLKRLHKNRPRETMAVLSNLETFLEALNGGISPKPPAFGFLHVEPSDVLAVDQKGGGNKLAQTRLYVYPDAAKKTLYLLTVGDKSTQRDDIETCKRFVAQIKALPDEEREGSGGQDDERAEGEGAADEADG